MPNTDNPFRLDQASSANALQVVACRNSPPSEQVPQGVAVLSLCTRTILTAPFELRTAQKRYGAAPGTQGCVTTLRLRVQRQFTPVHRKLNDACTPPTRHATVPLSYESPPAGAWPGIPTMRLVAVFVAFCMILIAGSAGAIGFLYFDLSRSQAATVAAATLAALAL